MSSDLAWLFGLLGVMANIIWPLLKQRRFLLLGQVIACVMMAMHFVFLEADTGALVMMVAGLQASLAIPLETHPRFKIVYLASLVFTPFVCWFTWQGIPSIFSSLVLLFFCLGNLQVNVQKLRFFLLLCLFCWVAHNIWIVSYPALLSNVLALGTSVYGYFREFKNKKLSGGKAQV